MSDFLVCQYSLFLRNGDDHYFFGFNSLGEESYNSSLNSGQPKIFVIKAGDEFLYAGYAAGSMVSRFSVDLIVSLGKACIKPAEFESENLDLFVFEFVHFADYSKPDTRHHYQGIQSELIYLIKSKTGRWPSLQKQINVSNENREKAKVVAEEMFESVK